MSDVIHGRTAWTRIPTTQLASWAQSVSDFESLAASLRLLSLRPSAEVSTLSCGEQLDTAVCGLEPECQPGGPGELGDRVE